MNSNSPFDHAQRSSAADRDPFASADTAGASEALAAPGPDDADRAFRAQLRDLDRDALGRFYEQYAARVYRYVRRMLGEDHLAEDVTQDIFMNIQRSLPTYDPDRELSPWVYTIATNKVRDFWRSRRSAELSRERSFDDEDESASLAASHSGPIPNLENRELGNLLSKAIDALPEGLRATLMLRQFEGLSFEAIGEILERNEDAVRKRYSRALAELRRVLTKSLDLAEGGWA